MNAAASHSLASKPKLAVIWDLGDVLRARGVLEKKLESEVGHLRGHASDFFERYSVIASLMAHAKVACLSSAILPSADLSPAAMLDVIRSRFHPAA